MQQRSWRGKAYDSKWCHLTATLQVAGCGACVLSCKRLDAVWLARAAPGPKCSVQPGRQMAAMQMLVPGLLSLFLCQMPWQLHR